MDFIKTQRILKYLFHYGEVRYDANLDLLVELNLVLVTDNKVIITNNWIDLSELLPSLYDFIYSLFCFNKEYQSYLLKVALVTALHMQKAEDKDGINEFVSKVPNLADQAISILQSIQEGDSFNLNKLEQIINEEEPEFRERNHFIFNGSPNYQRLVTYLSYVQSYKPQEVREPYPLGKKIDEQWREGRSIATNMNLQPISEQPHYVLMPYTPEHKMFKPQFQQVLMYPWKVFVLLCCIVREHYEAQGVGAIRFQLNGAQVDVLLMSSKNQEYRYGPINDFAIEFCKVNQYGLFPKHQLKLDTIFHDLNDRNLLVIEADEFRIPSEIEDEIYNTRIYIPLIADSKQFRKRLEQWIDELREKG